MRHVRVLVFAHIATVGQFVVEALKDCGIRDTANFRDPTEALWMASTARHPHVKMVAIIDRGATDELQERTNQLAASVREVCPDALIIRIGSENDFPAGCCDRFWSKRRSEYAFETLAAAVADEVAANA